MINLDYLRRSKKSRRSDQGRKGLECCEESDQEDGREGSFLTRSMFKDTADEDPGRNQSCQQF